MSPLLPLVIFAVSAHAEPFAASAGRAYVQAVTAAKQASARQHVSAQLRRSSPTFYWISEGALGVNLHLNAFGSGFSFSGSPFSGHVSGSRNYFTFSGSGISGSMSALGSTGFRVDATVASPGGASRRLSFSLYASGPGGNPRNPPRYTISEVRGQAHLSATPAFDGTAYQLSGTVDKAAIGREGTALAALATAVAWHVQTTPR